LVVILNFLVVILNEVKDLLLSAICSPPKPAGR
jgi:hypothetical protein